MSAFLGLDLHDLGAAVTASLGLMGLVRPDAAAAFTHVRPSGAVGVSEIRATYGGFFLALGAYALWTQAPLAFTTAGVAWAGAAAGRLVSVFVDRSTSATNAGGVVFEAAVAALLLFG